jgi:competence protein ComGC
VFPRNANNFWCCMNCIDLKNEKGFTLVELLLYLSVSAIIITVVSVFIITLNEVRGLHW